MRKPAPLPTRSAGRVNFLEGRVGDEQSRFHVEDKLVQSSGPSGRVIKENPRPTLADFYRYVAEHGDTPHQGQESPPTPEVATPPCKGTGAPLHIQLALPFEPEMTVWDPGDLIRAHADMAQLEARVAKAFRMPPGAAVYREDGPEVSYFGEVLTDDPARDPRK